MRTSPLIEKARAFAARKHEGQTRRNLAKTTLFEHVSAVAELIERANGTDEEIAAAYLHDTLEDTDTSAAEITREFGILIARIVVRLTDDRSMRRLKNGPRKRAQAIRMISADVRARRIKVADQAVNLASIAVDRPEHWTYSDTKEYIEGAALVVAACGDVGPILRPVFEEALAGATRSHLK